MRTIISICLWSILIPLEALAVRGEESPGLLAEIEQRNPELQALRAQLRAAGHAKGPAGALPDPQFMAGLSNLPLSSDTSPLTGVQFELRQRFPWFGTLQAREDLASSGQALARALLRQRRVALLTQARVGLWSLRRVEELRALERQRLQLIAQLQQSVEAAYAAGRAGGADLIRPRLSQHRAEERLLALDEQAQALRIRLNALRDRPATRSFQVPPLPQMPEERDAPTLADLPDLLERAIAGNPELQVANEGVQRRRQALHLSEKQVYPEFSLGLQYRLRWVERMDAVDGADFVGLNLGVSLPLWAGRKQSEEVERARAQLEASRQQRQGALRQLQQGMERELLTQSRLRQQSRLLSRRLLPDAQSALDAGLADFQAGRSDLPSVLDQIDQIIQIRRDLLQHRIALLQAGERLRGLIATVGERSTP